jgi:hypothetical protein
LRTGCPPTRRWSTTPARPRPRVGGGRGWGVCMRVFFRVFKVGQVDHCPSTCVAVGSRRGQLRLEASRPLLGSAPLPPPRPPHQLPHPPECPPHLVTHPPSPQTTPPCTATWWSGWHTCWTCGHRATHRRGSLPAPGHAAAGPLPCSLPLATRAPPRPLRLCGGCACQSARSV